MTTYRCDRCQVQNTAINDLAGVRHTRTGGKPSKCQGTYRPVDPPGSLPAPWRAMLAARPHGCRPSETRRS